MSGRCDDVGTGGNAAAVKSVGALVFVNTVEYNADASNAVVPAPANTVK